jgi:hypothetical protein
MSATVYSTVLYGGVSTRKGESVMTGKRMASRHIRKKSENNTISGYSAKRKMKVESTNGDCRRDVQYIAWS